MSRYRIVHDAVPQEYIVQRRFLLFLWLRVANFDYLVQAEAHVKKLQEGIKILRYYD